MAQTMIAVPADAELVARSLAGDRDAFSRIVARYQTLVCSVAYNGTGELAQSEDVAQETFLTAWRQLATLREPEKLRAWLCGITRNLVHDAQRRLVREPAHVGDSLEAIESLSSREPLPSEAAITRERETILWDALSRIPEIYREPLILFYREQQSVERVAAALDLGEDVVRQRLSRGRRLLQDQVAAFVEGTLARTAPGEEFTSAVAAALPMLAGSALGSLAAGAPLGKGSGVTLAAKIAAAAAPLTGLLVACWAFREHLRATPSGRARTRLVAQLGAVALAFILLRAVLDLATGRDPLAPVVIGSLAVVLAMALAVWAWRRLSGITGQAPPADAARGTSAGFFFEYRTGLQLLGLPLVHVRWGTPTGERACPAIGWIAIGERAYGLFALGRIAVGVLSVGMLSGGLLTIGIAAVGIVSIGAFAAGTWAMGSQVALGFVAVGNSLALGWLGAHGGTSALAHDCAVARRALALHANDAFAREILSRYAWMVTPATIADLTYLLLVPDVLRIRRQHMGKR